ncbi:MAG: hypothetical protein WKG07_05900 [Hymenobacter sp.]
MRLLLWRDDLLNSALPGNKARKLKYNLLQAKAGGPDQATHLRRGVLQPPGRRGRRRPAL